MTIMWSMLVLTYLYSMQSLPRRHCCRTRKTAFANLIQQFIHDQEHPESDFDTGLTDLPQFYGKIAIYPSAVATFYAPSVMLRMSVQSDLELSSAKVVLLAPI